VSGVSGRTGCECGCCRPPEAEIYLGRLSIEAQAGYQFSNANNGFDAHGQGFFGLADAAFYPIDNLRLALGYRYTVIGSAAAAGFEYQLPFNTAMRPIVCGPKLALP
jgi:hypothetical protein